MEALGGIDMVSPERVSSLVDLCDFPEDSAVESAVELLGKVLLGGPPRKAGSLGQY